MKRIIETGVCLLAIILSVMLPVTVTVIAQSGHSGSTQVIAHIEQPSAESSEETRPEQESSEISDDTPASTGDTVFPMIFYLVSMFCCAAIIVAAHDKTGKA